MISFFPFVYPDELLYSQLCRYHVRSGNLTYTMTAKDLYARNRFVIPDMLFLNRFNEDALDWICGEDTLKEVVINQTMFPSFVRFIPKENRNTALEALVSMEGNWNNLLKIPNMGAQFFRYCPVCANEDRKTFGETFYHRKHQIYRVRVCPEHGCYLEDTEILTSKMSPGFYDAESNIPYDSEPKYCDSETEIKLAKYVSNVFDAPIDFTNEYPIGYFLNSHLPSKYKTQSGVVRNITEIFNDYNDLYSDCTSVMEFQQMQKIFNGYRFDNYHICQLAMFLGITEKELTDLPKEMTLVGIDALYKSLSLQFDIEIDVVRHIGYEVLKYARGRTYLQRKSGPQEREWAEFDEKLFPQVKAYVDGIICSEGKPIKLSVALVQKAFDLPAKQAQKLPKCYEYIKSHLETYPQFWAREIEWAIKELDENEPGWKIGTLYKKLSLNKGDVEGAVQFIKDDEIKKRIIELFKE